MKRLNFTFIGVAILAGTGFAGLKAWNSQGHHLSNPEPEAAVSRDRIVLTDKKFAAAQIEVTVVSKREIQSHRIVPGRIEYDATRHVEMKSPFDGMIRRIDVKVGDRVTEGTVMAIVESPELGEGRADVQMREADLEQAVTEHDWWHSIQSNLEELLTRLKQPMASTKRDKEEVEIRLLEKEFEDKPLGDYRQQILTAYSRMRLADKLNANVKPAGDVGGISIRTILELGTARDTAMAGYTAACEQATFEVKQKHLKAEAVMKNAERRLLLARQRLSLLVNQPYEAIKDSGNSETLSSWPVKAPFTATVEAIMLAPKERIQTAQGLFQLADTSRLWVQAQIRERDWSALSIQPGQRISLQVPAMHGKNLEATVSFVGRTVALDTHAIPLTAEIDNQDGQLRPGMIVRVVLPDGPSRECVTVPQSAVTSSEGQTFVFIESARQEYRRRNVTTGMSVDHWTEVLSGLEPGELVVSSGTSLLKAELLLEPGE